MLKDPSSLDFALAATPALMRRIREFDHLEILPSKTVGFINDAPLTMPCPPELASLWTVYGHNHASQEIETFDEFPTETAAEGFRTKLLTNYPHLAKPQRFAPTLGA